MIGGLRMGYGSGGREILEEGIIKRFGKIFECDGYIDYFDCGDSFTGVYILFILVS